MSLVPQVILTEFTPWLSLLGGTLIGLSAVLMMALLGQITGVSGIVRGLLLSGLSWSGTWFEMGWRAAFIAGLVIAPIIWFLATGSFPVQNVSSNWLGMALAGLLVGTGTAIGSGCTSGHGVCGLARFSTRSAVAVVVFMTTAMITVFVSRHVVGFN